MILQPVEDDWYLLGQQLDIEESVLADIHKEKEGSTVQMKCLLQTWCTEGGTLTKLENALLTLNRKDLIPGKINVNRINKLMLLFSELLDLVPSDTPMQWNMTSVRLSSGKI